MTDHQKRLNSRTFISAGVKGLVYRSTKNPRLAVIVQPANRSFWSLDQWLGWLTPYASDAANAEQFLGDVVNGWLVRPLGNAGVQIARRPWPPRYDV